MTDRKLLELAAKAVGIEGVWCRTHQTYGDCWVEGLDCGGAILWNPLSDDGDALRLAVKLELPVEIKGSYVFAGYSRNMQSVMIGNDPYAAARRAIVRAVAEIGRTLP